MRKTRFMSLLFLMLALGFFFLPIFRQAIGAPLASYVLLRRSADDLVQHGSISPERLERTAQRAAEQHDAPTLAFVALHEPDLTKAGGYADQAVAMDPQLTWIYYSLANRGLLEVKKGTDSPAVHAWVAKLETGDPDNAVPYLAAGQEIFDVNDLPAMVTESDFSALSGQTAWLLAMQKAFAAPRFDDYHDRRLDLERGWMASHHVQRPGLLLASVTSYPIVDFHNIRVYASYLTKKEARDADAAGHTAEATNDYWTVAHFGERMQSSPAILEQFMGSTLLRNAYTPLAARLRAAGESNEAATVDYAARQMVQKVDLLRGKEYLYHSSAYAWGAILVNVLAALVVIFFVLTFGCMAYVNAKRWKGGAARGHFYHLVSGLENYAPILLFMACVGLYVSYYPFWVNFQYYLTAKGPVHNIEPLFYNSLPSYAIMPDYLLLPVGDPFLPYLWYAIAGIVFVLVLNRLGVFRAVPEEEKARAAAAR